MPLTYGNLAPRLAGVPARQRGRTVVAPGGLYYDSSVSIASDVINSGPLNGASLSTANIILSGDHYVWLAPNLQLPQVIQWNVSLEHGFSANDVVSLGYLGSTVIHWCAAK